MSISGKPYTKSLLKNISVRAGEIATNRPQNRKGKMKNYHFVVYADNERVGTADTLKFAKAIAEAYQRIGKMTLICIEAF